MGGDIMGENMIIPKGNNDNELARVHVCHEDNANICSLALQEQNLLSKLMKSLFVSGFTDSFDNTKDKIIACFANFIFIVLLITCLVLSVLYFSIHLPIYVLVIACLSITLELIVFGYLYYSFKNGFYNRHRNVIYCCTCPDKEDKQFHYSY